MCMIPSRAEVERIRKQYPAGCRIEVILMDDPYHHPNPGDRGTVVGVDDMGQIMMRWDNGSTLSLLPTVDQFKVVEE